MSPGVVLLHERQRPVKAGIDVLFRHHTVNAGPVLQDFAQPDGLTDVVEAPVGKGKAGNHVAVVHDPVACEALLGVVKERCVRAHECQVSHARAARGDARHGEASRVLHVEITALGHVAHNDQRETCHAYKPYVRTSGFRCGGSL
jgi:hypothetical protein